MSNIFKESLSRDELLAIVDNDDKRKNEAKFILLSYELWIESPQEVEDIYLYAVQFMDNPSEILEKLLKRVRQDRIRKEKYNARTSGSVF